MFTMKACSPLIRGVHYERFHCTCIGRTMREGSAKKNSYGKSRNGRTNIDMEGQRSNDGDESESSESFGVSDCSLRSGDLDNEKT